MNLWIDLKAVVAMLAIALGVVLCGVLCIWCVQLQEPEAARRCEQRLGGIWSCPERPEECACYRWGGVVTEEGGVR